MSGARSQDSGAAVYDHRPMLLEQWRDDVRLAWRGLRRARAFTAAAVLTLAVGVAGTTTMFALIEGVLLRPLPVREQDRLIVAWTELRSTGFTHWPYKIADVERFRDASQVLERVAGVGHTGAGPMVAVEDATATYINSVSVTGDFFDVLGVAPVLGRALTRADDVRGAENVLVVTHGLWQRRYRGSPDVMGRRLLVGERPFTIVGVMPPDVEYPRRVEAWMTVAAQSSILTNAAFRVDVDLIARMRPGVTLAQATAELQALTTSIESEAPAGVPRGLTPVVRSYEEVVVGDVRAAILILFGAVGLVLLIASANVGNLLLMRGETRRPEFAVRAALGAGRGRIARQLLAESVILALAAALVGLTATSWILPIVIAFVPDGLPRVDAVRIDATVVVFTVALAFLTAALAGMAPALAAVRTDLAAQLRSGGRGATSSSARHGHRALVVAQIALAVTVVVAAGLLTRSLLRLQTVDMGLAADRLVLVELALPQSKYGDRERHLRFFNDVIAQLDASPEIAATTPVHVPPFSGTGGWDLPRFTAEGQSEDRAARNPSLNLESIHPNYFDAFEVTIVRGRAFTATDRQAAPLVAIVSVEVAARTWPGEDPIGKRIKFGGTDSNDPWRTVVGVAGPTRYRELARPAPTLYLPSEQFIVAARMLVLRTALPVTSIAGLARDRVRAADPDVEVLRVAPFEELLAGPLARPRFNAWLIGVFGVAALLLAAIGLYAVMGAYVRRRYTEIGVRIAVGATSADVHRLVLGEGLRLAAVGAAIGLVSAILGTRLLRGLLFEVHPLDPAAIGSAALLLVGASALACYLPARRATRVDAVALLRSE